MRGEVDVLFNSTQYLIFLPLVVVIYHALLPGQRRVLLLLASYVFYATWNWKYLGLLMASTVVNYGFGMRIAAAPGTGGAEGVAHGGGDFEPRRSLRF